MKKFLLLGLVAAAVVSCAEETQRRKPVGPTSSYSSIPWNDSSQLPRQGMGQMGMLPQNQQRR